MREEGEEGAGGGRGEEEREGGERGNFSAPEGRRETRGQEGGGKGREGGKASPPLSTPSYMTK